DHVRPDGRHDLGQRHGGAGNGLVHPRGHRPHRRCGKHPWTRLLCVSAPVETLEKTRVCQTLVPVHGLIPSFIGVPERKTATAPFTLFLSSIKLRVTSTNHVAS